MAALKEKGSIPVDFYNKEGQVLIHRKPEASLDEIERLQKFFDRGVYYDIKDQQHLFLKPEKKLVPQGLSDTKLFDQAATEQLRENAREIFAELKNKSISSTQLKNTGSMLNDVFTDFEKQPEVMTGLLNIIEVTGDSSESYNTEISVKRAAVSMALKTRGLNNRAKLRQSGQLQAKVNNLMMSAIICDVGKTEVEVDHQNSLNRNDFQKIQRYPLHSFRSVLMAESLEAEVKRLVLNHRRPLHDSIPNNNYPESRWLEKYLANLCTKAPQKSGLYNELAFQLSNVKQPRAYDEDVNVLAIASDFASLTSNVPWRKAFSPKQAIRQIINQSFYSYNPRITREFLDYVSISLSDNEMIINRNDFVIMAVESSKGVVFDVGKVVDINRFQSRPVVERIASIDLFYTYDYKLGIQKPDWRHVRGEKRFSTCNLDQDFSRRIVYVIDPGEDTDLYNFIFDLTAKSYTPGGPDESH